MNKLFYGDCQLIMPNELPDKCVDMVLADLPYGMTKNSWDKPIPFEFLWPEYYRVAKENAAFILFGQDKFTAHAIISNEKDHRYNLIWKKGERTTGFLNANRMPLRNHEDLAVFYRKLPIYNPQMTIGTPSHSPGTKKRSNKTSNYGLFDDVRVTGTELKYPKSILNFEKPHPAVHPTQKSIELCEWLIRTYTDEGMVVLDNTMGIGTTCVAARNTGRQYIGIEIRKFFYNYAKDIYKL